MFERNSIACLLAVVLGALPAMLFVPAVGWAQMEEIVVTTRKREESLQDVPIAVTAFTENEIRRSGITSVKDVANLSSSVQFDTAYNPTDTRVNIRGLSATRGRSNVAFLIDGIDVTTENVIAAGSGLLANQRLLNDIQQIEVVKGPQSALFGRSAFAGAVSYTTADPGEEFDGDFRLNLADDGYLEAGLAMGGPVIGDVFGVRVNGVYWTDDGRYTNSVSALKLGGGDGFGSSLTAVFTPTDRLKFKGRVEYSDDHYQQQPIVRLVHDTPLTYPESAFLVGMTGGTSRDLVLSNEGNSIAGNGASTESTATVSMRDHGLYCAEMLDIPPGGMSRDERQLALKQMFPDYLTVSDAFIAANFPSVAPPGLNNPVDLPLSLQPLSDGLAPLVPGFCHPTTFGSAKGKELMLGENGVTGGEYDGTDIQTFRASLMTTLDLDHGSYSLNMGYTDSTSTIELDQDYQTNGRPDLNLANMGARSETDTEQTSVELRFASNWENSPFQLTLGALYWNEQREVLDQNFIIACLETSRVGNNIVGPGFPGLIPGSTELCDGEGGTVDSWQAYRAQLDPHPGSTWEPEIDHKSAYIMIEWNFDDRWNLTFEDRYVDEEATLSKPNFSSCTNLAFGIGAGQAARIGPWLDESLNPGFDARCTSDQFVTGSAPVWFSALPADIQGLYEAPKDSDVLLPGFPLFADGCDPAVTSNCEPLGVDPNGVPFGNIIGTEGSKYHTPKVTLRWMPTDDSMLYLSWARAQKPAGINALSAGGAATTIAEELFASEKMVNYEFGWKSQWEAGGALQVNGALFLQDYTDKQVGTQILVPDGQGGFRSNPRVINASAAQVWGLELDLIWEPDFLEGLRLSGSYTYLDAKYTNFVDETTTYIRSATTGACPVVWKSGEETVATGVSDPNLDPNLYPLIDRTYDPASGDLNPIFAPKCALDLSGNQLERSPEHAFVGSIDLTRPFLSTGLDWSARVDAIYQDQRFIKVDNLVTFEEYWLFNFQLGLASDTVDVLFYVDNVFDDDTLKTGGEGPDFGPGIRDRGFSAGLVQLHFFGAMPDPRRAGIRMNYRFR